jgi:hypothetical protein
MHLHATSAVSTMTTTVTEEDWFRTYNNRWRDTAYGRATHYATCSRRSHRTCVDAA